MQDAGLRRWGSHSEDGVACPWGGTFVACEEEGEVPPPGHGQASGMVWTSDGPLHPLATVAERGRMEDTSARLNDYALECESCLLGLKSMSRAKRSSMRCQRVTLPSLSRNRTTFPSGLSTRGRSILVIRLVERGRIAARRDSAQPARERPESNKETCLVTYS